MSGSLLQNNELSYCFRLLYLYEKKVSFLECVGIIHVSSLSSFTSKG